MNTYWSRNLPTRYEQVRFVGSLFVTTVVPDYDFFMWKEACLHRIGGPAVYCDDSIDATWYRDGRPHRCDGPAIINQDWYQEGRLHRIEGPAQTTRRGGQYWYLEGALVWAERLWMRRARRLRFLLPCK